MKRFTIIIAAALIAFTGCAQNKKEMNTLVAYFSATGTTEVVAQKLAEVAGADLYEIRPEVPYTQADLDWTDKQARSTVEMHDPDFRPPFVKDLKDADKYDVIYVGYPIWWYTAPSIINTFIEEYGFAGKKVIMFATSGGSTPEKALKDFSIAYPDINWAGAKLLNGATKETLKSWVDEISK